MADYIIDHARPIDRALLSDMLASDPGEPMLEVKMSYHKDARRRGLKLSIYRTLHTTFGHSYDLLNDHNGQVHIADMPRKPSPKIAANWKATVEEKLDAIAVIALADGKPDWKAIQNLFSHIVA
jgi:hypothetical protein